MKNTNDLGVYYTIPEKVGRKKYKGCGNGRIVVNRLTDEVIDMDYLDDNLEPLDEQNIHMSDEAGQILALTETTMIVRANFSCWHACLF